MPQISVIVPVYKVEPYLRRCVDSILTQTLPDFELILVDDGSPDNCGKICDEYAELDNRVVVIHQENGGLSAARNAGLDIARGKYIGFVDSDDYIHPQMYEVLLDILQHYQADVVCCDFLRTTELEQQNKAQPERIYETTGYEVIEKYYEKYQAVQITTACNKLYKKEIFAGLRYETGRNCEDDLIAFPMYHKAKKVVFVDSVLYYYFQTPNSIMRGNRIAPVSELIALTYRVRFLRKKPFEKTRKELIKWICEQYIWQYGNVYLQWQEDAALVQEFKNLNKAMRGCVLEILGCSNIGKMQKLGIICMINELKIARKIFRTYLY